MSAHLPSTVFGRVDEEYRQTVDVRTGLGIAAGADQDADTALIDDNHELDLADVLRREIVVADATRMRRGLPGTGIALRRPVRRRRGR